MDEELKIKLLMSFFEFKKNNAADIALASKQLGESHGNNACMCLFFLLVVAAKLGFVYFFYYLPKREDNSQSEGWAAYLILSWIAIGMLLLGTIINSTLPTDIFSTVIDIK